MALQNAEPSVEDQLMALEGDTPDNGSPEPKSIAATPPPEPAPTPTATPAKDPAPKVDDDPFAGDIPKAKPASDPKPDGTKPDGTKAAGTKPDATKPPGAAKPSAPATAGDQEFKTNKELREAYNRAKAERDALDKEREELRKQIDAAKKAGATEAEARLKQELEAIRKERDELDSKVRFTDYSQSAEFKKTYIDPLAKTWSEVLREIKDVKIQSDEGEQDATPEHMQALVRMPMVAAARQAREWFGDAAPEFMRYRKAILDGTAARDNALEEWRTKGSEMAAQQQRQSEERSKSIIQKFDSEIDGYRKNSPDVYAANEKDAEEQGYFKRGNEIVAIAFRGEGLKDGMTQEQRQDAIVRAQANVAAKASAFGVVVHRWRKAEEQIEALKQKLSEYEKTEPGHGDGGRSEIPGANGKPVTGRAKSAEDIINEMPSIA